MIINKAVGGKHENLDEENKQKEATVLPLLKESIEILETSLNPESRSTLDSLLDRAAYGPEEFYQKAGKGEYFESLKHFKSGMPLTNICEHMLLQGLLIHRKHTSFWFAVGLKFHEK